MSCAGMERGAERVSVGIFWITKEINIMLLEMRGFVAAVLARN